MSEGITTSRTITLPSGKEFTLRYMPLAQWVKPSVVIVRARWSRPRFSVVRQLKRKAKRAKLRRQQRESSQGCGWAPEAFIALCQKYDNQCIRCHSQERLYPDHVIPLCKGGAHDLANIQPLCFKCNFWKGTKIVDFRPCLLR